MTGSCGTHITGRIVYAPWYESTSGMKYGLRMFSKTYTHRYEIFLLTLHLPGSSVALESSHWYY